jgi:hypothetical protein
VWLSFVHHQQPHKGKEQFRVEVGINSASETMRENIKISAKESLGDFRLKKHKPWFDEGCSRLLKDRKEAKLQ